LVFLLWLYHFRAHGFVTEVAQNRLSKSGAYFRIWNEGATLLLFSIVFLAILKNSIDWIWGTFGIVILPSCSCWGINSTNAYGRKTDPDGGALQHTDVFAAVQDFPVDDCFNRDCICIA